MLIMEIRRQTFGDIYPFVLFFYLFMFMLAQIMQRNRHKNVSETWTHENRGLAS